MKRLFINIAIFSVVIVALDYLTGGVCKFLIQKAKGGVTYLSTYICNEAVEDCMIFGSSRAMHHYDPSIIGDSLGMSCYNCGKDGNGIILMYGRYLMISERHAPKVLLYEVTSSFDLCDIDNHTFLPSLRRYYDRPGITPIFFDVDSKERYKMLSKAYRHNSALINYLSDAIRPLRSADNGYIPIDKNMEYEPEIKKLEEAPKYDNLKLEYIQKLIDACKANGTQLVFLTSPLYKQQDASVFDPLEEIAMKYNIPYISHYCDPNFIDRKDYFSDHSHMNRRGATEYSKVVASEVKKLL